MATLNGSLRGNRNSPPAAATRLRLTSGMPKRGVRRGHDQVARQSDLGPAGEGRAVHGGDDGFGPLPAGDAAETPPRGGQGGQPPGVDLLEVGAGAEHRRHAGEDAHPQGVVSFEAVDGLLDAGGDVRR